MERPLPVPLAELPEPVRSNSLVRRTRILGELAAPLAPLLGELVRRKFAETPATSSPPVEYVRVEALSIRISERADGVREWQLAHVSMEKPRRRWQPGRWVLVLSCLAGLALAATRTVRLDRQHDR
ncbi:MAG: hypothetical protein N2Z82_10260 [Thermomicrobium sp.]|nr:hypothetical protein [Thermomicrobium sp.]